MVRKCAIPKKVFLISIFIQAYNKKRMILVDKESIEDFKCEFVSLHLFQLINLKLKYFVQIDHVIPQSTFEQIEKEKSWSSRSLEIFYQVWFKINNLQKKIRQEKFPESLTVLKIQRSHRQLCLELFRLHCQPS